MMCTCTVVLGWVERAGWNRLRACVCVLCSAWAEYYNVRHSPNSHSRHIIAQQQQQRGKFRTAHTHTSIHINDCANPPTLNGVGAAIVWRRIRKQQQQRRPLMTTMTRPRRRRRRCCHRRRQRRRWRRRADGRTTFVRCGGTPQIRLNRTNRNRRPECTRAVLAECVCVCERARTHARTIVCGCVCVEVCMDYLGGLLCVCAVPIRQHVARIYIRIYLMKWVGACVAFAFWRGVASQPGPL